MKKAKVSIIIPAYNASKYLNRCLDSILNQSFKDLEVLVILNGCTDNSLEILTSYNKKIKVFELPKPSISEARNLGIKNSSR
jgi:glycosyltransferase involved in cell wall biosynthesis